MIFRFAVLLIGIVLVLAAARDFWRLVERSGLGKMEYRLETV